MLKTNAPLTSKPAEFFYMTVLDVFQPRAYTGVFSGDRLLLKPVEGIQSSVSLCIRGVLPFAKPAERQILDMALFSLLTMYMGRLAKDPKMTVMACSAYTAAIRDFRNAIGLSFNAELVAANTEYCQLFLALFTALQLFEVCAVLCFDEIITLNLTASVRQRYGQDWAWVSCAPGWYAEPSPNLWT
jgi:hypothetical protein